jgi:NDP-sugar pyrophosphorylase family protein
MLPIGGQPLIEHLVRWLQAHGISEVAINLHHRPEAIVDHLGSGATLGVHITYSREERLLGTAGAAKRLERYFEGAFLVVYGDGYTNFDLGRLLRAHDARRKPGIPHVTMALHHVDDPTAKGVATLDTDGRITRFIEKPSAGEALGDLVSAGVIAVEHELLDLIPAETESDFGRDILPLALRSGIAIYGEQLRDDEVLIDIGTPGAYRRACSLAAHVGNALAGAHTAR